MNEIRLISIWCLYIENLSFTFLISTCHRIQLNCILPLNSATTCQMYRNHDFLIDSRVEHFFFFLNFHTIKESMNWCLNWIIIIFFVIEYYYYFLVSDNASEIELPKTTVSRLSKAAVNQYKQEQNHTFFICISHFSQSHSPSCLMALLSLLNHDKWSTLHQKSFFIMLHHGMYIISLRLESISRTRALVPMTFVAKTNEPKFLNV